MKLFQRGPDPDERPRDYDLQEMLEVAAQGRRLAIYDRTTNLYAYWYLQLRATEEISRGQRHGKGVTCISLWAPTEHDMASLTGRLQKGLRDHDLAAYLNNGHFVVLLTETDPNGANVVLERLTSEVRRVSGGFASFPADGSTFEELLACAKKRAASLGFEDVA